jgi:tetratricopeptide (TPR) repeat protein
MKITSKDAVEASEIQPGLIERAQSVCAEAKELQEAGEFERARAAISEFWQRIGERPRVDGLDRLTQAEVFLRAGALSGWIGSARQIPGAQETAKDLISEASRIFETFGLKDRVAEARVDLAVCYWREGAYDEARVSLDDALLQLGELDSEQRLRVFLNQAIVARSSNRYEDALKIHRDAAPFFEVSNNDTLKAKFHNQYATVLKNVGLAGNREDVIDQALVEYSAASFHAEQVGNERFLVAVENNLGFLFTHLAKFEEAHEHIGHGCAMARKLNDKGLLAQLEDSRARAFLAQGRNEQAEAVAREAVKILSEGDEQALLAGAMTTYAIAVARIGRYSDALATLNKAIDLAGQAGDFEGGGLANLTIIEELASVTSPEQLRGYYRSAASALSRSQHQAIAFRLGECARTVIAAEEGRVESTKEPKLKTQSQHRGAEIVHHSDFALPAPNLAATSVSLEEQVLSYEGELIKQALEASEGSVTRAARMLGITHQGLAFILNGRQKNLLAARKPVKRRRRSIIRYH